MGVILTILLWTVGVVLGLWLLGFAFRRGRAAVVNRDCKLVGADAFKAQLPLIRSCHIRGRLRGGKTKLAYVLGKELIDAGIVKGAIANIPTMLPLAPEWWYL